MYYLISVIHGHMIKDLGVLFEYMVAFPLLQSKDGAMVK